MSGDLCVCAPLEAHTQKIHGSNYGTRTANTHHQRTQQKLSLSHLVLASLNVRRCEYLLASGFETFGVLKQLDEVS